MSNLTGGSVKAANPIFNLFLIVFLGLVGLGLALSWKATNLIASEYQEFPQSQKMLKIKDGNFKTRLTKFNQINKLDNYEN